MLTDPADHWLLELVARLSTTTAARAPDGVAPLAALRQHSLAPLAHRAGIAALRDDYARALVLDVERTGALAALTEAFAMAGVPTLLLKGVAYARTLYDDPAERPMTDVDLLVPRDHHRRARAVLARRGFHQAPSAPLHHATTHVRGELVVDLHHTILHPLRGRIDLAAVWERATPAPWMPAARLLDDIDAAVFHFVHMVRHRLYAPLIQYVDARRLLHRASAARVIERARTWGVGRAVQQALAVTMQVTGGESRGATRWPVPSVAEIVRGGPPHPIRRVCYDAATVDGPRQLLGWLVVATVDQLARRRRAS